ncbi:MAG: 3'-5' exonuclease [Pseudomonadota bacterium]
MAVLSLRFRIFLFFVALAFGAVALVVGGLWVGYARAGGDPNGYGTAGLIAGFGILGLVAGVGYLFDENVAKPITRIAADLRTRTHAGVSGSLDQTATRYLGDLGPAAAAVSQKLSADTVTTAQQIAAETARLSAERAQLTAALSEIPVAVLMLSEDHRIVLYDGQAAAALEPQKPLCLGHSVFEHLERGPIVKAADSLSLDGPRTADLTIATADGAHVFEASLRGLGSGAGYLLTFRTEPDPGAERPLVFDFDLVDHHSDSSLAGTPLNSLTYVIFDTETTGLLPEKDDVVQIGAVRLVNGRLVQGEVFDTLVDPKRSIPPTSTKVHGITDAMVEGAPTMAEAGARFRQFAKDAILVAHNAPFDMAFMKREAAQAHVSLDNPVFDTILLSAAIFGAEATHTLDAIADRLEVEIPEDLRHTALGDAEATALVFQKLLMVLEAQGITTFEDAVQAMKANSHIVQTVN